MNTSFYAGIDMGGTNIKGAITTPLLETICTDFIPTVPDSGDKSFETITARAVMLIERMMEHAGLAPEGLKAVGMGMMRQTQCCCSSMPLAGAVYSPRSPFPTISMCRYISQTTARPICWVRLIWERPEG